MMIIAPNSRTRKGGGDEGGVWKNFRGGGGECYGRMVQPTQHYVAPFVKEIEWELGTRSLRIVEAFWAGIPVSIAYPRL